MTRRLTGCAGSWGAYIKDNVRATRAEHPGYDFYRLVKDMAVEGFYTSRVGLIDVLEYRGLSFLPEFPGCTHPEHQA